MITRIKDKVKEIYFHTTGYSYPNLGRLFLRLFLGLMLMQFGVRQLVSFNEIRDVFPAVMGMDSVTTLMVMIAIELLCSMFIMFGFLTRLMLLPPFVSMVAAAWFLLSNSDSDACLLSWQQSAYLPMMFLGIIFFLLIVGPGKISVDYFLSLHIIHTDDRSEDELEEI